MGLGLYRTPALMRASKRQMQDGLRGWHEFAQGICDSELLFAPLVLPWILGLEIHSEFS